MIKAAVLGLFLMMGVLVAVVTSRGQPKNPASTFDRQTPAEDEPAPTEEASPPVRPPSLAAHRENSARQAPAQEKAPPAGSDQVPGTKARTHEEVVRELDNAFRTDQPANERSAKTTAAIVAAFSSPGAAGAHLSNVDCRATRCRFELDFADKETDRRVLLDIWDLLGSSGADVSELSFFVASREQLPDEKTSTQIHLFPAERRPVAQLGGR